jgi:phosphate transport system substrate-binding protein
MSRPSRAALLLGLALAACGGDRTPGPPASGSPAGQRAGAAVTGAGATFPNPIYSKWFDAYHKETGVRINYQSIGSGGGIRQFTEGTVDFGATDGPMTDQQIAAVQGKVLHVPTVLGAVVATYNLPALGKKPLRFDGSSLADIFLGRITKWNDRRIAQLNPGVALPDEDILVVHRSDGSGTTYIFTDYLSKVSPEWKSKVGRATSVEWPAGLGPPCGRDPERGRTVRRRVAPDRDGRRRRRAQFAPDTDFRVSITNAAGGEAYPISSFTWLLIHTGDRRSPKDTTVRAFLDWMLEPGAQRMAADLNYAPLPVKLIELVKVRLEVS